MRLVEAWVPSRPGARRRDYSKRLGQSRPIHRWVRPKALDLPAAAELQGLELPGGGAKASPSSRKPTLAGIQDSQSRQKHLYVHVPGACEEGPVSRIPKSRDNQNSFCGGVGVVWAQSHMVANQPIGVIYIFFFFLILDWR